MEISDIRRRFRTAVERAKKDSAERRARGDAAAIAYSTFLHDIATPVFRMFANVARAEGHAFVVYTPASTVQLVSERNADDFIELFLDTSVDPPQVTSRVNRRRGGDVITSEQPLKEGAPITSLEDEDVLVLLLREIGAFVER